MAGADLDVLQRAGASVLAFHGSLRATNLGPIWTRTLDAAGRASGAPLVFDVAGVSAFDTVGATLLLQAERLHGGPVTIEGASKTIGALLELVRAVPVADIRPALPVRFRWAELREAVVRGPTDGLAFLGEAMLAIARVPSRRKLVRLGDLLRIADQAGVRAVPLVVLMGTLIGLILAFQSAVPMRRFGAELYVANLVGISLLRELGPLLAAVILSGRTGSAFAAEIGTMKVNQEIDALATLGIDPMTMLVLPRLAAAVLVMPVLTLVLDLAGLVGMTIVMVTLGFPPVAVAIQVSGAVRPGDLYGGLFKAAVFGAFVAAIGCRCGLTTGVGPRAVGLSTTAAVVGGIVTTIVLDGLFALLFFRLGL